MAAYKRNQIEDAISTVFERSWPELTRTELASKLKRLLEGDRALGRTTRSTDPEKALYAFHSAAPPGSGTEVWYSEYEGFALLVGTQLMGHGWPHNFAVSVLRRVRQDLERAHAQILKQDRRKLFDQEAIRSNAKPGAMAFNNADPVFLTIVMKSETGRSEQDAPYACAVCRGPNQAMQFIGASRRGGAMFELVNTAYSLSAALALTEPKRRGRS
jgi:hypothetical protein